MPWTSKRIIRYLPNIRLVFANLHILILALSGAGKSTLLEVILILRMGKWKCIDVYDEMRGENMTYSLKETDPKMLALAEEYNKDSILHGKKLEGKAVQHEVIMPPGKKLSKLGGYKTNLPANIKIRSFDEDDLKANDLMSILGKTSKAKDSINAILYDHGDDLNITALKKIIEDGETDLHATQKKSLLRDIKGLLQSGMFSKDYPRLDIDKLMEDKDTLTSFSAYPLETDKHRALFFGLIISKIINWRLNNQDKHRVCLGVREISHFGGREDMEGYEYPFHKIKWIAKEGRDAGLDLVGDAQSRIQILPEIRGQFGTVFALKCFKKDAEKLEEVMDIPKDIIEQLPTLEVGTALIIDGAGYNYPVKIPPPLHHHKARGESVFDLLADEYGLQDV